MTVAENLRDCERDDSAVEGVGQVGQTHDPDGNAVVSCHADGVRCAKSDQATMRAGRWPWLSGVAANLGSVALTPTVVDSSLASTETFLYGEL
jgi:hypothetical protein